MPPPWVGKASGEDIHPARGSTPMPYQPPNRVWLQTHHNRHLNPANSPLPERQKCGRGNLSLTICQLSLTICLYSNSMELENIPLTDPLEVREIKYLTERSQRPQAATVFAQVLVRCIGKRSQSLMFRLFR